MHLAFADGSVSMVLVDDTLEDWTTASGAEPSSAAPWSMLGRMLEGTREPH